jgi:hypothetical protein
MDLGIFRRTRVGLSLWVFGLPVALVVLYYGTDFFSQYVSRKLEQRSAVMQLLPDAVRKLDEAQATLKATGARVQDEASATAEINTMLSRVADETEFTIVSLKVRRSETPPPPGLIVLAVEVEGSGYIQALMEFLHAAQREEALLMVRTAKVQLTKSGDDPQYRTSLTMNYYFLAG